MKINKKWVDIDSLDLPSEAKEGLKELRKQLGLQKSQQQDDDGKLIREKKPADDWKNVKLGLKIFLPLLLFTIITILLAKRRTRLRKLKKR